MSIKKDDWRLFNQEKYLKNIPLKKVRFIQKDNDHDHTHCTFCWDKFSENNGDLHMGYSTLDERYWICEVCYQDFREMFQWTVINQSTDESEK